MLIIIIIINCLFSDKYYIMITVVCVKCNTNEMENGIRIRALLITKVPVLDEV